MSYGHAHGLNETRPPDERDDAPAPPFAPEWYEKPAVRPVLAVRHIAGLYRLLKGVGLTQREIAALTGQSQSEVSEILAGRQVLAYDVLVRIAEGLGIPRELMGLSYGAYGGDVTVADPLKGVSEMLRRHLLALGGAAAFGAPVARLGELLEVLPGPSPVPMPSALSPVHVKKVRNLTRRLGEAAITSGSDPEVSTAAAAWASRLLDVPGSEPVTQALRTAVGELHIRAGWAGFDAGLHDRAMWHYAHGLNLATEVGDAYLQALALNCAGLATEEHGHPNDGLKILQLAQVTAWKIPPEVDRDTVVIGEGSRAALEACAQADSATAYACLGEPDAADTALAKARELWQPTRTDPGGDLDRPAACLKLERGHLDAAEQFAVASVRRWDGISEVGRTGSAIVLATIHVRAGEPHGLSLAHSAITSAGKLTSVRARHRLVPLAAALEARSGGDARQLARMARQVVTTRA